MLPPVAGPLQDTGFERAVQVRIGEVPQELLGHHGLEGLIVDGGGHGHWAPGAGGMTPV